MHLTLALLACRAKEPADLDGDGQRGIFDCDEDDPSVFVGAPEDCDGVDDDCDGLVDEEASDAVAWYADADGDGYGDPDEVEYACNAPDGFLDEASDCDDTLAGVNPGAAETCDGLDDDCDGLVDEEGDLTVWYADADGDGYGDAGTTTVGCGAPDGYVTDASDCDDADPEVNPAALEHCDGSDEDCDGSIDEDAVDPGTWYPDADGDGYGDEAGAETACDGGDRVDVAGDCDDTDPAFHPGAAEDDCTDPNDYNCDGSVGWADADADGWAACEECADGDAAINPGATEICNEVDDDCDGTIDADATDASTWYTDADGDGYGDPAATTLACDAPAGAVADATDCDDAEGSTHPGADETCDGADDDCDGLIDEDGTDATTWYADTDGDGYGDASVAVASCGQPTGYVADDTDCDDTDATVNPDAAEVCDGLDQDCDGSVDEGATGTDTWYADTDGDGFGDPDVTSADCTVPAGYTADDTDCDDTDITVNPAAPEICDGLDQDCDGVADDGATGSTTGYADTDGDGYGDPDVTTSACTLPSGYVADDTDCDDADATVNPAALEVCNGVDDDCEGTSDGADAWWDSAWPYRIPLTLTAPAYDLESAPFAVDLDFDAAHAALGGTFDSGTIRVVLQDCALGQPELPSQFLDTRVALFDKLDSADPAGDGYGSVAFLYDEDGDYGTAETLLSGASVTVAVYFGGTASAPSYGSDLSTSAALLENSASSAAFDSAAGGVLDTFTTSTSASLQSQTDSCCGNSIYSASWNIDPQDTTGTDTLVESGPVVAIVEASGSRSDSQSAYDYLYTYVMFTYRPELWVKVYQVTTSSSRLSHPSDSAQGIRPWEARRDAISSRATFTTDLAYEWGDVSSSTWGIAWGYVQAPTYVIALSNYDPYLYSVANDAVPSGHGTNQTLAVGTAFMEDDVMVVYPHAGTFTSTVQDEFFGLVAGATITEGTPEAW